MAINSSLEKKNYGDKPTDLLQLNLLCEFLPPEGQGLLKGETYALQKETVLEPPIVAEMVVLTEGLVEMPHAGRIGFHRELQGDEL